MTMSGEKGFTLVEMAASIALGGLILAGISGILWQFQRLPSRSVSRLTVQQEMRTATTWVRLDANKAQSFQAGTSPEYGTFRWLDFSAFPATRREVTYFWEDGVMYRQPTTEGVAEPRIPLVRHIEEVGDVVFSVTETPHDLVSTSTERVLTASLTATIDSGLLGELQETTTVRVELRPEQLNALVHRDFYLHNNPTPPTGDTTSQLDLPLDETAPTATTLHNYDTNRDSSSGLTVKHGRKGGELDSTDATKTQDWVTGPLAEDMTVDGRISLFVKMADGSFNSGKLITIAAWILDFDPSTSTETPIIKQGTASFTSTSGWLEVSLHFRPTVYAFLQGHKLKLRFQIDGISESIEGMVAYDTTDDLSFLRIPTTP